MVRKLTELQNYYRGNNYPEYRYTDHWQKLIRTHIINNSKAKCFICGKVYKYCKQKGLTLHHVTYENLFREKLNKDVFIICLVTCHKRIHFSLLTGRKTPIVRSVLLKRMYFLKYTYFIRSIKPISTIEAFLIRMS